jgi:mRNA-degrading endonuclease RelE of RelBE toxin-antitoxin system
MALKEMANGPRCRVFAVAKGTGECEFVDLKSKPFRVLCFFDGARVIVCTHAFKKKEKIAAEIRFAERQKAEYFASKARGELRIEG